MKASGRQILTRIDRRLRETGLSERAASLRAGLSADAIRSVRRQLKEGRQRGISTETLEKLAPVLSTTPEWLLSETGAESGLADLQEDPENTTVPVKGYVAAGALAHFLPLDETEFDRVEAPQGATPETVALEIRGESLGALFDRWLVFFDQVRSPVTPDLIGKLCVVGLADGRVVVKKLKRAGDGLFDLLSNTEEPVRGVAVEWAARVKTMAPR